MGFPTDKEFEHQRQVIRETFPQLFDAVESELRYVDEHLPGLMPKPASKFDLALAAHLARATKTTLGIFRACEHGFGEIAMGALRTLGETTASAYWMSLDKDARADQFEQYAQLEAIATKKFVDDMGWADVQMPAELHDKEWIAKVEARFPNPVWGWMQQPMNRVIAAIRPCWPDEASRAQLDGMARTLHEFGDRHSHVGASDTVRYLRVIEEEGLTVSLGPTRTWVPQALFPTAWWYGQTFDLAAETWTMADLAEWREQFNIWLARCTPLTPEEVRDVGRNDPCPCGSEIKFKKCHLEIARS
jgi:hypothetical protein